MDLFCTEIEGVDGQAGFHCVPNVISKFPLRHCIVGLISLFDFHHTKRQCGQLLLGFSRYLSPYRLSYIYYYNNFITYNNKYIVDR